MNKKILGLTTLFSPLFKKFTFNKKTYRKIKEWKVYLNYRNNIPKAGYRT